MVRQQEIEDAVAIIVAADKQVEMDRFQGKHVIEVPVTAGIRRPKELIEQALKQDAPIYQGKGGGASASASEDGAAKGKGGGFYKHLMSGVINMLPFVVGGGILVAVSFFWGINATKPGDPTYNEFAAVLNTIGGTQALGLIVAVLAGFIAMCIAESSGVCAWYGRRFHGDASRRRFLRRTDCRFLGWLYCCPIEKSVRWSAASA
jgi:PTS system fructose-specific IIC component